VRSFEVGLALITGQSGKERITARWTALRDVAVRAETLGFDTVWTPDELLWRWPDWEPQGWWGRRSASAPAIAACALRQGSSPISAQFLNLNFLALAVGRVATVAEDRPQVLPGRFVRGNDGDAGFIRQ
jgi:hypothetical protein